MSTLTRTRVIVTTFVLFGIILVTSKLLGVDNNGIAQSFCPGSALIKQQVNATLIKERLAASESKHQQSVKDRDLALSSTSITGSSAYGNYGAQRVFWDFFYPTFDCPHLTERVGRLGDGGKWVCGFDKLIKMEDRPCIVYSFGVNQEFSYEEEIVSRSSTCIVRMYDPTVSLKGRLASFVTKFSPRVTFEKLGIGKKSEGHIRTLGSLMQVNGDEFIDILKIDIEGHEFDTLTQILEEFHDQLPFGQLQLEIHVKHFNVKKSLVEEGQFEGDSPGKIFLKQFVSWWEQLEGAGLRAFHREANYIPSLNSNQGFIAYFEFVFLNIQNKRNVILQQ